MLQLYALLAACLVVDVNSAARISSLLPTACAHNVVVSMLGRTPDRTDLCPKSCPAPLGWCHSTSWRCPEICSAGCVKVQSLLRAIQCAVCSFWDMSVCLASVFVFDQTKRCNDTIASAHQQPSSSNRIALTAWRCRAPCTLCRRLRCSASRQTGIVSVCALIHHENAYQ